MTSKVSICAKLSYDSIGLCRFTVVLAELSYDNLDCLFFCFIGMLGLSFSSFGFACVLSIPLVGGISNLVSRWFRRMSLIDGTFAFFRQV